MTRYQIKNWMLMNVDNFIDNSTGEVNCTALVEAWDRQCDSGEATLDENHIAWEVAVEVAEKVENK